MGLSVAAYQGDCRGSVGDLPARHLALEVFVDAIVREDLGLKTADYVIEQEIEPVEKEMISPNGRKELTHYVIYPVDVWVDPARHSHFKEHLAHGDWVGCEQAPEDAAAGQKQLSPTAAAVFELVLHAKPVNKRDEARPHEEELYEALRRLLCAPCPNGRPWTAWPANGSAKTATASVFCPADARRHPRRRQTGLQPARGRSVPARSDARHRLHLELLHREGPAGHSRAHAPVVEVYGILSGRMEIWWKAYHDRGTSAWSHRILEAGDWIEVDSLQCHYVNWLAPGKGVVFKAGPGPLAEVGKLGVKGKTPCKDCSCMKPCSFGANDRGQSNSRLGHDQPQRKQGLESLLAPRARKDAIVKCSNHFLHCTSDQ